MQYITPVVVTSFPCFNKVTVLEWSIFIRPYKRDLLYLRIPPAFFRPFDASLIVSCCFGLLIFTLQWKCVALTWIFRQVPWRCAHFRLNVHINRLEAEADIPLSSRLLPLILISSPSLPSHPTVRAGLPSPDFFCLLFAVSMPSIDIIPSHPHS